MRILGIGFGHAEFQMVQRLPSVGDKWTGEHAGLECWGGLQVAIRGQGRRGAVDVTRTDKSNGKQQEGRGKASTWSRVSWGRGREADAEGKR